MKIVKCPSCSRSLQFDETKINPSVSVIKCPVCKAAIQIKEDSRTEIPLFSNKMNTGMLVVQKNEETSLQTFFLKEGMNGVGRKATTSEANIQVATEDRFFSRHHFRIDVKKKANGETAHIISNWQNTNKTKINGYVIEQDEEIILKQNDLIEAGSISIKFIIMSEENR
jgi:pSer/pThr/pTyr-binding forkhead associated (FHA) protein